MIIQTFDPSDIFRVFFLTFLEILLSTDNAVILGILASHLPQTLRKKALFIGVVSAFFLRAAALLSLAFFIKYQWLQIFGAAYLIYLAIRHFVKKQKTKNFKKYSFWKTVVLIELFDLAFAVDSIIAGIAFVRSNASHTAVQSKLWIIYLGGMLGLIGIRFASHFFSRMIHLFPQLETNAYIMVGLIGIKLIYTTTVPYPLHSIEIFFWILLGLLFLLGLKPKNPL